MKKLTAILFIGCLVLLISSSIFANEGIITGDKDTAAVKDSVTLKAWVEPFASVHFLTQDPNPLTLSNLDGQKEKIGTIEYQLETNCNVYADGFGTAFRGVNFPEDWLKTSYQLRSADPYHGGSQWKTVPTIDGFIWAPEAFDAQYVKNSTQSFNVDFKAELGDRISAQRAGNYRATYTVTIWHPTGLN